MKKKEKLCIINNTTNWTLNKERSFLQTCDYFSSVRVEIVFLREPGAYSKEQEFNKKRFSTVQFVE